MAAGTAGLAEGHSAYVLGAAELLGAAWRDVTKETIAGCWMKAGTLPAEHQADLAQASGKRALRGFTDAGVAKLVSDLNALSVGVQEAAHGSGVQDKELAEVLVNLQIVPGQPAYKAAIDAVQAWTGLEEQEKFTTALLQDSQDEQMARVNMIHVVEDPFDDELDDGETVESTDEGVVAGGSMPPPSYAELSSFFGLLEYFAQSSGNGKAGNLLRRARVSFIRDFASKPGRQADMRELAQA